MQVSGKSQGIGNPRTRGIPDARGDSGPCRRCVGMHSCQDDRLALAGGIPLVARQTNEVRAPLRPVRRRAVRVTHQRVAPREAALAAHSSHASRVSARLVREPPASGFVRASPVAAQAVPRVPPDVAPGVPLAPPVAARAVLRALLAEPRLARTPQDAVRHAHARPDAHSVLRLWEAPRDSGLLLHAGPARSIALHDARLSPHREPVLRFVCAFPAVHSAPGAALAR